MVSSHQATRKRLRLSKLGLICAAAVCQTGTCFVAPSIAVTPVRTATTTTTTKRDIETFTSRIRILPRQQPLRSASATNSMLWTPQTSRRLSPEEQQELLRQVVEVRRIKQVESELQQKQLTSSSSSSSKKTRSVTALQLARATGYGEELLELEEAVAAGEMARELLVTTNMGLVYYCVKDTVQRKRLQSVTADDLIQEGAIGLARAVDRWNPVVGGKFSTYAFYWIRAAVLRGIAERDDLVRVPEHVSTAIAKVSAAAQRLGLSLDSSFSSYHGDSIGSSSSGGTKAWKEAAAAKALAEAAGLTNQQLLEAMKVRERRNGGILSFESWMQLGKDYETDLLAAATTNTVDTSAIDSAHMKQTLSRFLRPREMEALSWRYGLNRESSASNNRNDKPVHRDYLADAEAQLFKSDSDQPKLPVRGKWGEAMSFVEVGKHMQVSAEYGRKLCHAALDKLRRAADEGTLEPALLLC